MPDRPALFPRHIPPSSPSLPAIIAFFSTPPPRLQRPYCKIEQATGKKGNPRKMLNISQNVSNSEPFRPLVLKYCVLLAEIFQAIPRTPMYSMLRRGHFEIQLFGSGLFRLGYCSPHDEPLYTRFHTASSPRFPSCTESFDFLIFSLFEGQRFAKGKFHL